MGKRQTTGGTPATGTKPTGGTKLTVGTTSTGGTPGREPRKLRPADIVVSVLVLGSIWGVAEVIFGGALKAWGISYRTGVLTGVGMGIMGVGLAIFLGVFRRPLMLLGIAIVAVLCKQLVVPILNVSVMCKANSCLAVVLQGSALAGVAAVLGRRLERGFLVQMAGAASAALLARGTFYFAGLKLAPCPHLLSFAYAGGFVDYMAANGLAWAGFSAILFPLGYRAGALLRDPVAALGLRKPALYYSTSVLAIVCCWLATAVAISAGF